MITVIVYNENLLGATFGGKLTAFPRRALFTRDTSGSFGPDSISEPRFPERREAPGFVLEGDEIRLALEPASWSRV